MAALDRKSTRLNSSHTEIYTLSLHDALPIWSLAHCFCRSTPFRVTSSLSRPLITQSFSIALYGGARSEEHTSELQSHRDLHSFPTRRSSDLVVSSLLLQIDALPSHVVVITATNHAELLDRAVWRRFQIRLSLPSPTVAQKIEWFARLQSRLESPLGMAPN